jgi:hypothetical protein
MNEEKHPLILTYLIILLCVALVYIYKLIKIKSLGKKEISIAAYFFLTLITEYIGGYIVNSYNSWLFNLYLIISIPMIIFYLSTITHKYSKKLYLIAGLVYLTFAIINIAFLRGFWDFNFQTLILGDIIITPLLFVFLYQLMQQVEQPLHLNPHFYNVVGFLIFFLGNFAYFMLRLNFQDFIKEYGGNLQMIIRINNVLTYSIFLIGALCLKTSRK